MLWSSYQLFALVKVICRQKIVFFVQLCSDQTNLFYFFIDFVLFSFSRRQVKQV
jgi:hypothetical protein